MKPLSAFASPTAALLAAALVAAPAAAAVDAKKLVAAYSPADVEALLNDFKASPAKLATKGGNPAYTVKFTPQVPGQVRLTACNEAKDKCQGLALIVIFDAPEGVNRAQLLERVNRFNVNQQAGKGLVLPDGRAMLQSYHVANGGVTLGNLATEMRLFVSALTPFSRALIQPAQP